MAKYFNTTNLHSDDLRSGLDCEASVHGSAPSVEDYEDLSPQLPTSEHGAHTNVPPMAARANPLSKMSSTSLSNKIAVWHFDDSSLTAL